MKEKGKLQKTQVARLLAEIATNGQSKPDTNLTLFSPPFLFDSSLYHYYAPFFLVLYNTPLHFSLLSLPHSLTTHSSPSVHQPLLKALDRTDILEAPNRFKNRQKETRPPPAEVGPSAADYDGLSTLQRKTKKAQKFGVKVGAVVSGADVLQVALRRQNSPREESSSRPPSEFEGSRPMSEIRGSKPPSEFEGSKIPSRIEGFNPHSEILEGSRILPENGGSGSTAEIEGSRPSSVFEPPCEDDSSRPPPPRYPPPRSKKAPPPPPPGSRSSHSPSSSPAHSSAATSREGTPTASPRRRPPPHRSSSKPPTSPRRNPPSHRSLDSPRSARPINITVIPSNASTVLESQAGIPPRSPIPKPRKMRRNLSGGSSSTSSEPPSPALPDSIEHRRLSGSVLLSSTEMGGTPMEAPRGKKRPVGGVKSLPAGEDPTFNKRERAEKMVPTSSDVFQPMSSNLDTQTRPLLLKNGAVISHAHQASHTTRGQENSHGNHPAPPGNTNTARRRALLAKSGDQESTLDFPNAKNHAHLNTRQLSNSVPDLLEDTPNTSYAPPALLLAAPPTGNGVARARGLAASNDALFDGSPMDYYRVGVGDGGSVLTSRSTSQYSDMSAVSGGSGIDTPPQVSCALVIGVCLCVLCVYVCVCVCVCVVCGLV